MTNALSLPRKAGLHIAFTGIDGAGKTTQAGKLAFHINQKYGPTYLAEPRTDLISQMLHALAWQHGKTSRRKYFGNHAVDFSKAFDVVSDYYSTIRPLLASGMHVVEPRSIYCRIAMAFAMNGARDEKTEQVLAVIPKPDLLFWINTSPSVALARIQKRGVDIEKLSDLRRFSQAYHKMPESADWAHIQGDKSQKKLEGEIKKHTDALFVKQ